MDMIRHDNVCVDINVRVLLLQPVELLISNGAVFIMHHGTVDDCSEACVMTINTHGHEVRVISGVVISRQAQAFAAMI